MLDEVQVGDKEKWNLTHWSPLQSLCALFNHSDELSTIVADSCAHFASSIITVMRNNGPSSSQAAELLHTIIENASTIGWLEEIEPLGEFQKSFGIPGYMSHA